MYRLINSDRSGYLFDELQFDRFARFSDLIIPGHCILARACAVEWSVTSG
jgi:hypothetical protein